MAPQNPQNAPKRPLGQRLTRAAKRAVPQIFLPGKTHDRLLDRQHYEILKGTPAQSTAIRRRVLAARALAAVLPKHLPDGHEVGSLVGQNYYGATPSSLSSLSHHALDRVLFHVLNPQGGVAAVVEFKPRRTYIHVTRESAGTVCAPIVAALRQVRSEARSAPSTPSGERFSVFPFSRTVFCRTPLPTAEEIIASGAKPLPLPARAAAKLGFHLKKAGGILGFGRKG